MSGIDGCPWFYATAPCVVVRGPCSPLAPTCPRCGTLGPPCEPTQEARVDLRTGEVTYVIGYCGID